MLLVFEILVTVLILLSASEYITGMVLDIAFMGILARGQHPRRRLLLPLLVKLAVWISASAVVFLVMTVETADPARASLRQTFLVLFVMLLVPLMLLRKPYAKWVARTVSMTASANRKNL